MLIYVPFNRLTQPYAQESFMELCFHLFKLVCVIHALSKYTTVYAQYNIKIFVQSYAFSEHQIF